MTNFRHGSQKYFEFIIIISTKAKLNDATKKQKRTKYNQGAALEATEMRKIGFFWTIASGLKICDKLVKRSLESRLSSFAGFGSNSKARSLNLPN